VKIMKNKKKILKRAIALSRVQDDTNKHGKQKNYAAKMSLPAFWKDFYAAGLDYSKAPQENQKLQVGLRTTAASKLRCSL
jgi:hypothetical protein